MNETFLVCIPRICGDFARRSIVTQELSNPWLSILWLKSNNSLTNTSSPSRHSLSRKAFSFNLMTALVYQFSFSILKHVSALAVIVIRNLACLLKHTCYSTLIVNTCLDKLLLIYVLKIVSWLLIGFAKFLKYFVS